MRKRSNSNGKRSSTRSNVSNQILNSNSQSSSDDSNDNNYGKISKIHSNTFENAADKYVRNCRLFDVRVDAGVVVALKTG